MTPDDTSVRVLEWPSSCMESTCLALESDVTRALAHAALGADVVYERRRAQSLLDLHSWMLRSHRWNSPSVEFSQIVRSGSDGTPKAAGVASSLDARRVSLGGVTEPRPAVGSASTKRKSRGAAPLPPLEEISSG